MPDFYKIEDAIRRAYIDDGVSKVRFLNNMVLWMRDCIGR